MYFKICEFVKFADFLNFRLIRRVDYELYDFYSSRARCLNLHDDKLYFTLAAFHFTRSNLTQTISFDGSQLCLFCILYPRLSACLLWLNLIKILSLFV